MNGAVVADLGLDFFSDTYDDALEIARCIADMYKAVLYEPSEL